MLLMASDIFHFEIGTLPIVLVCSTAVSASICLASSSVRMPFLISVSTSGFPDAGGGGDVGVVCARALRVSITNIPVTIVVAFPNFIFFINEFRFKTAAIWWIDVTNIIRTCYNFVTNPSGRPGCGFTCRREEREKMPPGNLNAACQRPCPTDLPHLSNRD